MSAARLLSRAIEPVTIPSIYRLRARTIAPKTPRTFTFNTRADPLSLSAGETKLELS